MTFTLDHEIAKSAGFSECGAYRYWLCREWDRGGDYLIWLMLNPSTADATIDDPTIRRCMGFAQRWGFGGITVVNLYAYRATDPKALRSVADPVGWENDATIRDAIHRASRASAPIVAAWGANADAARVEAVAKIVADERAALTCLGTTASGAPRHPLYVRADTPLIEWRPTEESTR